MKRIWKSMLVFLAVCALAIPLATLAAAGSPGDAPVESNGYVDPKTPAPTAKPTAQPSPTQTPKPNPKSVKLNKSGTVDLNLGSTLQLKAATSPSSAKKGLTWSSSDESVATVDQKGKVTAVGWGVATITAKAKNGKKDSVKVNACFMFRKDGVTLTLNPKGVLTVSGKGQVGDWVDNREEECLADVGAVYGYEIPKLIKEIVVKKGITQIGDYAFFGLENLRKVTVAGSVKKIGTEAFSNNFKLKEVKLNKGLKTIGKNAFDACIDGLTSITIPAGVQTIQADAFVFCIKLKTVSLPKGLRTIGDGAFFHCDALKTLTIPRSVTSIGSKNDDEDHNIFGYTVPIGSTWSFLGYRTTIRGYRGSAAEKYAKQCGLPFKAIG